MAAEIRILTNYDAEAFSRLRLEALEREPRAFGSSVEDHLAMSIEAMARRLQSEANGKFTVGAFADGMIIGSAGFYREDRIKTRHKGVIWGVYVNEVWRGRGVARQMMTFILDRLRGYGDLDHVTLHVTADQTAARRLYASLGFECCGHERRALRIGDEYVDQDHMVLWI